MNHEQQTHEALRSAVSAALADVSHAVRLTIAAQEAHRTANSLIPQMQATVAVILACEALTAAAKLADSTSRNALAAAMSMGATTVQTEHHAVSLRDAAQTVRITDATLLPAELLRHPPPEPDKAAIKERLNAGETIPGAALSNGGAPTVQIRRKS